jgi:phosphate transport system ATP-binding protein
MNPRTNLMSPNGKRPPIVITQEREPVDAGVRSLLTGLRPVFEPDPHAPVKVSARHLNFFYGSRQVLYDINLDMRKNQVTALIGPSGSGKTTFLRTINRMNDVIPSARAEGAVTLDGQNVLDPNVDVARLRLRVGMVFQRPNPFPKSIYENIAYALKVHKYPKSEIEDRVEKSLREATLWDDVKDKLKEPGTSLSGGQQQRLCIARAIALRPEVLLMDEPASAFFLNGQIKEVGPTMQMFMQPRQKETEDFITGRFG